MLTIANITTLAADLPAKDFGFFAWAVLLSMLPTSIKAFSDLYRDARNKGDSAVATAAKESRERDEEHAREIRRKDEEIAKNRHEQLTSAISAMDHKIDSTNDRIKALETEVGRLRESDSKLSIELARLRPAREAA